jgi:hypothetical protein
MKTFIIITDNRKFAEYIENNCYGINIPVVNDDYVYLSHIESKLLELKKEFDLEVNFINIYTISDFIDLINNNEIDISNYYMSYVSVN